MPVLHHDDRASHRHSGAVFCAEDAPFAMRAHPHSAVPDPTGEAVDAVLRGGATWSPLCGELVPIGSPALTARDE